MPKFELKNYKQQRGHEGIGFYCMLWIDGVKAAEVINQADGGPCYWTWFDEEAHRKWDEHVAAQPEEPFGHGMEGTFKPDEDCVIEDLCIKHETRKKIVRACKTKTLFKLKDDKPEVAYRSLNMVYSPQAVEYLQKKFGDNLGEIINETLATEAAA